MHGSNVRRLDVVLILGDGLLELFQRNLVILNDTVDLELLDTETNVDELVTTPNKTVNLKGLNVSKELIKVSLIIPRLNIEGNNGLSGRLRSLSSLLGGIFGKSLLLDLLSLLIDFLVVRAEEIDIIVVLLLSGGRSSGSGRAKIRGLSALVTRKGLKLG